MNKGQMLLEVTVAVGLMVLVLVAAAKLTTQSIKTSRIRIDRQQASKMVNACLNMAREEKDNNVSEFFLSGYEYKTRCPCQGLANSTCGISFYPVETAVGEAKKVYVIVYVNWDDNGAPQYETGSVTFTQVNLL